MDTVEGLGDVARRARDCAVMGPAAGAALGVDVPARLRTMADIRALYRPWCAAVGAGLLHVDGEGVTAGPTLENWPPDDATMLARWLAGLRAVCAAESRPHDEDSVRLLALALLTVLNEDGAPAGRGLWHSVLEALQVVSDGYGKWFSESWSAADQYAGPWSEQPLGGLVALLAEFENHVARAWRAEREPVQAAREILAAADGMSPLQRSVAVRLVEALGDDALPAWREFGDHLHEFTVGKKRFSAFARLEETEDEDSVRIRDAAAAGGKIAYTYDFGTYWQHEITVEKTLPRDHSKDYPVCVAFQGDSPVEYWSEEEPEEPEPFGLKKVNRRLVALGRKPA